MLYAAVFAGVLVPVTFALLVWVIGTAVRIYAPDERHSPFSSHDPAMRAVLARLAGLHRMSARDIRADLRAREREYRGQAYCFEKGQHADLPRDWVRDVRARCN